MKMRVADLISRLQLDAARKCGAVHRELDMLLAAEQERIAREIREYFDDAPDGDDGRRADGAALH